MLTGVVQAAAEAAACMQAIAGVHSALHAAGMCAPSTPSCQSVLAAILALDAHRSVQHGRIKLLIYSRCGACLLVPLCMSLNGYSLATGKPMVRRQRQHKVAGVEQQQPALVCMRRGSSSRKMQQRATSRVSQFLAAHSWCLIAPYLAAGVYNPLLHCHAHPVLGLLRHGNAHARH